MKRKKHRPLLLWAWVSAVAFALFSLYFFSVTRVLSKREALQDFATSFDPLSAFFTALAFFGLVFTLLRQAKEIEDTKKELVEERKARIKDLVHATRLQAAGLRLISMSIERDENTKKARRELEIMVQELEEGYHKEIKNLEVE